MNHLLVPAPNLPGSRSTRSAGAQRAGVVKTSGMDVGVGAGRAATAGLGAACSGTAMLDRPVVELALLDELVDPGLAAEPLVKPSWDRARRVLTFGGEVIKQFTWPARNQELILAAFEELGWPEQIDDPLPVTEGISPKDRLHDTIKCLNRKRLAKTIRFAGDGSGQGVCWRM